ncbi:MAG: serine/threonine protein kinase [Planctomycetes bacterium]|nr:serine/threonine protein kinase [Planctomycetota bacterium]
MPTLSQLAQILIACKVTTAEAWQRVAKLGGGDLAQTLDALADAPPWWAADAADPPPGLTEYQRSVIELWWEDEELPLHRQLALNQFLILQKLGQGGQGAVYHARQLNPARFVAIKTLTQDTESRRRRFEQEAKAMMRVQHPGVARFYLYERVRDEANQPTDEYLIAMEYVEGTDLYRLVQDHGPLPWRFVARWAVDVLGGLAVIHKNGFIHRDVKPANIMIVGPAPGPRVSPADSPAKLLDFGAVKQADDEPGSGVKRVFVGTREYAPPEQWGGRVVPASDLYAFGATLFHALAARPPYQVEGRDAALFMRAHARAPIPDVRDWTPDVPEPMSRLIMRMLAKDPDDRSTAAELVDEFRELLPPDVRAAGQPKPANVPRPAKPKPKPAAVAFQAPQEPEEKGAAHVVLHPFLTVLELLFLPARLRPPAGQEPGVPERVTMLLRRPLFLLAVVALIGLFIYLIR